VQLALTEPQEDFVFCADPYPAMCAGLGAGKSEAGISRLLIKMLSRPGINTAYYMPTYDLLRLRAMPGTESILLRLGLGYTTNRSEYRIHIKGYGDMIFRSYDRPERIVAYEVAHSIADELDTLPYDKAAYVWRKISERNRQQCGERNTAGNVTTPDQGYSGFTYSKWGKNPAPGYTLIKAATTSNPFLPDGYVDQIRANYDPVLAEMYINGDFVSLTQNKVYHFFDRKKHHMDRVITDDDSVLHVSIDFNVGGCCAVTFVIDSNIPIAVDEFVSNSTEDFVARLNAKYDKKKHKVNIYPDASGKAESSNAAASDIAIIRSHGYHVDVPNKNPFIRDRVNSVNALLSHTRMMVNTDKCQRLTDAIEAQGYDTKGQPEKFKDHPSIDDWTDSMGYFIHRKYPVNRPVIVTSVQGAAT